MTNIIVTLTTVSDRLHGQPNDAWGVKPGLKTILEQTNVEYEVHFNIPYAQRYQQIILPEWLLEMQKQYSHLKIFRCPDFGPITKIYPTLQRVTDPEAILITADDDLWYEDGFILAGLRGLEKYPHCVVGHDGMISIEPDMIGRYNFANTLQEDTRVRILQGFKTVTYRRKYFEPDFDEFAFLHWNDDIVISAYMGYKHIKKMVLKCENCTDFSPRVESFPVHHQIPIEADIHACNTFRRDETIMKRAWASENEWYRLHYLER